MIIKVNDLINRREINVELPEGSSIKDLLENLGISPNAVSLSTVNGVFAGLEKTLNNRDQVNLIPFLGGG